MTGSYAYVVVACATLYRPRWRDYAGRTRRAPLRELRADARSWLPGRWSFLSQERLGDDPDEDWRELRFAALLTERRFAALMAEWCWKYEGESGGILSPGYGLPCGIYPSFVLSGNDGNLRAYVCPLPARGRVAYDFSNWDAIHAAVRARYFDADGCVRRGKEGL